MLEQYKVSKPIQKSPHWLTDMGLDRKTTGRTFQIIKRQHVTLWLNLKPAFLPRLRQGGHIPPLTEVATWRFYLDIDFDIDTQQVDRRRIFNDEGLLGSDEDLRLYLLRNEID